MNINDKIHYLELLEVLKERKNRAILGKFLCHKCNTITTKIISGVKRGEIKSCGCLSKECLKLKITHGKSYHPIYSLYKRMLKKCKHEQCVLDPSWKDFNIFYNWVITNNWDKTKTIARIIPQEGFSPINCKIVNTKKVRSELSAQTMIKKYGKRFVNSRHSKPEEEIRSWLQSITNDKFNSDYTILAGKELDCYSDKYKLAIEYCGLRWHNEKSLQPRTKWYHLNKLKICRKKQIRLLTVFGDEWNFRKDQVKNFIKSVLGIYNKKIGARECTIKQINFITAQQFINENHIQPLKQQQIFLLGLYYLDQLVAVMTFGRHHRGGKQLVLSRFCCADGYLIVGGASKLFKHGTSLARPIYNEIISWSDNRWSEGNVYTKLGFTLSKELPPDYSYVKINSPKYRESKQSHKKSNTNCPANLTEYEWATQNNYARIWDCGKKRWIFQL